MECPKCKNELVYGNGSNANDIKSMLYCSTCGIFAQDYEIRLKRLHHDILTCTRDTLKADRIMKLFESFIKNE